MNKNTRNNLLEMKYLIKSQDYYRILSLYNSSLFEFGKLCYDLFINESFDKNDLFSEKSHCFTEKNIINQFYKIRSIERSLITIEKDYRIIKKEFEVYKNEQTR